MCDACLMLVLAALRFALVQPALMDELPLLMNEINFFQVANISSATCFCQCFVVSGLLNTVRTERKFGHNRKLTKGIGFIWN